MRISERQRYKITNTRVENARSDNAGMLEQISTLKKINKLSDNPIGASQVVRLRDKIENLEAFKQNIEFSKGYLDKSETAVMTITDNLIRAKELAIGLANAPYDGQSREAAAREVSQIMDEIVSQANSSFANRYVFSGFRTQTPTMAPNGQFLGDDGAIFLQVNGGDYRQVNVQARYLFESSPEDLEKGHYSMYDAVEMLHDGLMSNDVPAIQKAMAELNHQIDKTTSYQATLGSLTNALDSGAKNIEGHVVSAKDQKSQIEEVDMFKASTDFHRSEAVLQSTLLASNKTLQPSLLNFMQ